MSAGDPIDPCTGDVFTEVVRDFELAGNLPVASCTSLHLDRIYKTSSRSRDVGFGYGWTHTFAQELEVYRHKIVLWKTNGSSIVFPPLRVGESAIGESGYQLERRETGYVLDCNDFRERHFAVVGAHPRRHRLVSVVDWNGNRCTLTYQKGSLVRIDDAVGRSVRLVTGPDGRIARIEATDVVTRANVVFGTYEYDVAGNLVTHVDADGFRRQFTYDDDHRMTSHTSPSGLRFVFHYDAHGRCVETWGAYVDGRREPALAEGLPPVLADGETKAKGIYHVKVDYGDNGYSECCDSLQVKRYFANAFGTLDKAIDGGIVTRTYDDLGLETAVMDAVEGVQRTERDARGRELRIVDQAGGTTAITRDSRGRPTEIVDELGGVTTYEHDARGNIVRETVPSGAVTTFDYDERGLLRRRVGPTGGVRSYSYDAHANLIEVRLPNGAVWRFEYNGFGACTAVVLPNGGRRELYYSAKGAPVAKRDEHGNVFRYALDDRRNVRQVIEPGGGAFDIFYGGVGWVAATRRAAGQLVRFGFDRDGRTVQVWNGNGELHRLEYGRDGQVFRETTFDGRVFSFRRDGRGLVTRVSTSYGDREDCKYDARGLLVELTDQADLKTTYTYDAARFLTAASTADAGVRFERNATGDILVDRQQLDGEEVVVRRTLDPQGNVVRIETSLGYELEIGRDVMCEPSRVVLGGSTPLEIERDLCSLEVARKLPGGGVIRVERDLEGRLRRQSVLGSAALAPIPNQPDRVGGDWLAPEESAYRWSPTGELVGVDTRAGTTEISYDPSGRLVAYERPNRPPERVTYDPANNAFPEGVPTTYGPGGRIQRRGPNEYVWNDAGHLVEKRVVGAVADGGPAIWRYTWHSSGLLAAVRRPDGGIVSFRYDVLARRLEKTVRDPRSGAAERTRFVYDGNLLIQEVTSRVEGSRAVPVRGREYAYGAGMVPTAHADVAYDEHGAVASRTWYFYVTDPFGFPEKLVDERGDVAATLTRAAFGAAEHAAGARTRTPLRKLGQYHDDETGLCYNRWRYYDPEAGRFISPDPLGLHGGIDTYSAGVNPLRWDDPFGLSNAVSDRATQLRDALPYKQSCYAIGLTATNEVLVTANNNGRMPSPRVRDSSPWPNERRSGDNPPGAIGRSEFAHTEGTGNAECDHAEQRMVRFAADNKLKIKEISATNNCCSKCKEALIQHNSEIKIADPNGKQVHP